MHAKARRSISATLTAFTVCVTAGILFAQVGVLHLETGEQIYKTACVACHGADGRGTPTAIAGFEKPDTFPDFTRCDQTTPEMNNDWRAVIVHGGRYRGFSQIMPSFDRALTPEQIEKVIQYLRHFCREQGWPRGELNLPRALVTEKAFPEDEEVISTSVNARGGPGVESHIIHEQRFGKRNQIEFDVPINFQDENHVWYGGIGDATLGLKRAFFSNLRAGSIFALQGSLLIPSGNRVRGFGSGTTTFETFAAYDQLFKTNTFIQTQFGADLPRHTDIAPQSVFFNTAIGQIIATDHRLGRAWTPMMEFIAERDLVDLAKTKWDVLPQMQVTISHRQHIRGDFGVRVPATNTTGRAIQLQLYLLWDWQDGKIDEGW
jgi:hypothetical protein